ncbi:multicopper oxidase domain-containing protein, partial [Micrococcus sp. SIMBA_144]
AQEKKDHPVRKFVLTAEEKQWNISEDKKVSAWTYNGTVPGESLHVAEGDVVQVKLVNELDVPVTIHWHGVLLPNKMDGIPGLT